MLFKLSKVVLVVVKKSKFESYEKGNVEDDYSGGDIHLDGGTDRNGNDLVHGHAEVRLQRHTLTIGQRS